MSRIVFTWELGAGMGHVVPYLPIVTALKSKGHELFFILRDLTIGGTILEKYNVTCFQAPVKTSPAANVFRVPCTYPHILHNSGFDRFESLNGTVIGWQALFDMLNPDTVIFDHSPTALLAAHKYSFKKLLAGTGFTIPPPVFHLPNLRHWIKIDAKRLESDEAHTLMVINKLLVKQKSEPLRHVSELFTKGENILLTLKELDPYAGRENGIYLGSWISPIGDEPVWPDDKPGKKIFAYLKPFPALPHLLSHLNELKIPTIVYIENAGNKLKAQFSSPTLKFAGKLLDMDKVSRLCDLAILNATHNTVITLLLAGKPSLLLPLNLEQYLTGKNVEKLGAGVNVPVLKPDEIIAKLKLLLDSSSYYEAGRNFSSKYGSMKPDYQHQRFVNLIERMPDK